MAMPTFAVEIKSGDRGTKSAELQCAYDSAIMVDAARTKYESLGKELEAFWKTTQALTLAYNGSNLEIKADHAVNLSGVTKYHNYSLYTDNPLSSYQNFKVARKHIRNAQDWCRERATRTLDELRYHRYDQHQITPSTTVLLDYSIQRRCWPAGGWKYRVLAPGR